MREVKKKIVSFGLLMVVLVINLQSIIASFSDAPGEMQNAVQMVLNPPSCPPWSDCNSGTWCPEGKTGVWAGTITCCWYNDPYFTGQTCKFD
jgi:hypothetical protein